MRLYSIGRLTLRFHLLFLLGLTPGSQAFGTVHAYSTPDNPDDATVTVIVRDASGNPVAGLSSGDFILTEDNERVPITAVSSVGQPTKSGSPQSEPGQDEIPGHSALQLSVANVLLIISPMSADGRHDAIRSALKIFAESRLNCCNLALLDDSGTYTQGNLAVKNRLDGLQNHISPPQYVGGEWMMSARKAIEELGLIPGRRAVIFVSDYESKLPRAIEQNPYLLRADPSIFVVPTLRAHAAMYTIQSSGPTPVIPFGDAASQGTSSGSGPDILASLSGDTVGLGNLRSRLLYAAAVTGGSTAEDIPHALVQIARDTEGCYILHFRPTTQEADSGWHLLKLRTTVPQFHVSEISLYKPSPASAGLTSIPPAVIEAFQPGIIASDLKVESHAWFFPDGRNGVYTLPTSVDVSWVNPAPGPGAGSRVKIYARLRNESIDAAVGFREAVTTWSADPAPSSAHWQDEFNILPGEYTLTIVALDPSSGMVGNTTYSFTVHSVQGQLVAASSLIFADSCYSDPADKGARTRLSDPLDREGCELQLNAKASFPINHRLTFLLRLYPASQKLSDEIVRSWKVNLVAADAKTSAQHSTPLTIEQGEVRGLVVSGTFLPADLQLGAGIHKLALLFEGPRHERFAAEGTLTLN